MSRIAHCDPLGVGEGGDDARRRCGLWQALQLYRPREADPGGSPAAGDSGDCQCGAQIAVGRVPEALSPLGPGSIPPEWLMRVLLLQAFHSLRSERQLVERI